MTTDEESQPAGEAGRVPVFRCKLCERMRECTSADAVRDVQNGWPRCCEQPMELILRGQHPGAAPLPHDPAMCDPPPPDVDGGRDADSFKHNPGGQRS